MVHLKDDNGKARCGLKRARRFITGGENFLRCRSPKPMYIKFCKDIGMCRACERAEFQSMIIPDGVLIAISQQKSRR